MNTYHTGEENTSRNEAFGERMDRPVQEGKLWGEGLYLRWASGGLGQPKGTEKVQTRGKREGGASPGSLGDQLCDPRGQSAHFLLTHPRP